MPFLPPVVKGRRGGENLEILVVEGLGLFPLHHEHARRLVVDYQWNVHLGSGTEAGDVYRPY